MFQVKVKPLKGGHLRVCTKVPLYGVVRDLEAESKLANFMCFFILILSNALCASKETKERGYN